MGDVNALNKKGFTILMEAAMRNRCDIIRKLVEMKCNLDAYSVKGSTALMLAVKKGNLEAAKALIEAGASAKCVDNRQRGLDHYARKVQNLEMKEFVIKV